MTPDRAAQMKWVKEHIAVLRAIFATLEADAKEIERLTRSVADVREQWLLGNEKMLRAESSLAALRAVIQAELDSRDSAHSLTRIAYAAGLWPKGEQVPLCTPTLQTPKSGCNTQ